jgi:hypothetical protein
MCGGETRFDVIEERLRGDHALVLDGVLSRPETEAGPVSRTTPAPTGADVAVILAAVLAPRGVDQEGSRGPGTVLPHNRLCRFGELP